MYNMEDLKSKLGIVIGYFLYILETFETKTNNWI